MYFRKGSMCFDALPYMLYSVQEMECIQVKEQGSCIVPHIAGKIHLQSCVKSCWTMFGVLLKWKVTRWCSNSPPFGLTLRPVYFSSQQSYINKAETRVPLEIQGRQMQTERQSIWYFTQHVFICSILVCFVHFRHSWALRLCFWARTSVWDI